MVVLWAKDFLMSKLGLENEWTTRAFGKETITWLKVMSLYSGRIKLEDESLGNVWRPMIGYFETLLSLPSSQLAIWL